MNSSTIGVVACLVVAVSAPQSHAQQYPAKPVRLVVPYAPGGGVDILARIVARKYAERMGAQFIVENRAGGGTVIGTDVVARAAPDGYTLLVANPGLSSSPALNEKLPFDPVQSFAAVGQLSSSYSVLVVHPSLPVTDVKSLVALSKARPGQINYASAGTGSAIHLAMEVFQRAAGIGLVHIQYKGAAPAMNDVLGGQVPIMFASTSMSVEHFRTGRLRPLGVGSTKRLAILPNVPTIAESGLAGFEVNSWIGIVAPANTPQELVSRLNGETNAMLKLTDTKEVFASIGFEPAGSTPDELGERIRKEVALWRQILGAKRPASAP